MRWSFLSQLLESEEGCVHAHMCVCVCVCVSACVYKRPRTDSEIQSLGACVFSVFVCRIKAALVTQRRTGPTTDCSPTYSSHLMWINGFNCGPSLEPWLVAQQLNPPGGQEGIWSACCMLLNQRIKHWFCLKGFLLFYLSCSDCSGFLH